MNKGVTWATRLGLGLGVGLATAGAQVYRAKLSESRLLEAVPEHPSMSRDDRLRVGHAIERTMGRVLTDPTLDAQMGRAIGTPIRDARARKQAAHVLSGRGISRLTAGQIEEVYAIKLALAQGSPLVCAGMWNGRVAEPEVIAALARLPTARMERWMQLSTESLRVALRPGFTPADEDQAAVDAVISRAAERMDETRRTRFQHTIDQGPDAPPLDGCAAWIALLEAARDSDPSMRERFYRTMARP